MSFILRLESCLPVPVIAVLVVGLAAFFLAFCFSIRLRKKEGYLSAFLFFGALSCAFAYLCEDGGRVACATLAIVFCTVFGGTYPLLLRLVSLSVRREQRRQKRRAEGRRAPFVLPDKNNDFLRDRLRTSLCEKKENFVRTEEAFQLPYVRRAIAKLKTKNLSPADRIEVDRISGEITAYCYEERLSDTQLRLLNSHFARVLKLSAKYTV